MGRRWSGRGLVLVLVGLTTPAYAAFDAWVERATIKVLPDRPVGATKSATLESVRNEWEAFQVVVRSSAPLRGVDVQVSALVGPDGATIDVPRTHVYREWLLDVTAPSGCFPAGDCSAYPPEHQRKKGRYPDPLVPLDDPYDPAHPAVGAPFEVPADTSQALFVDVYVPVDALPGRYEGTLVVSAEGEADATIPVTLEVWDVALPTARRVGTSFRLGGGRERFHGGTPEKLAAIERNYEVALHDHHIDLTSVDGPLEFRFGEDGALLPVDWTAYDAAVGPKLDGQHWPDGQPPVRFSTDYFEPGRSHGAMTDDQYAHAAAAFAEHLQERGWLSRAWLYSSDEPFLPGHEGAFQRIPADVALLNRYTTLWDGHVLVTNPFDERLAGAVDIWCPVTPMYDDWFWTAPAGHAGRDVYDERRAMGEELWFYVCNANFPPWAGYDIDAPLGHEPRIVKWGAFAEKATGFLYWRTCYWFDDDPWHHFANVEEFGTLFARNGDGLLLYPGGHDGTTGTGSPEGVQMDGPALSYRLKMARDGLEDWELFLVAVDAGAEDYVRAEVARAYRQFGAHVPTGAYDPANPPWTLDDALLFEVRRNVVAKMLYLRDPSTYPDPEAPPPVEPSPEAVAEPAGAPDAGTTDVARDVAAPELVGDTGAPVRDVVVETDTGASGGGSGGCATGAPSGGAAALLGLLALVIAARRRA